MTSVNKDGGCLLWIKNSDTAHNIKIAIVTIVAATALAALVTGGLLVLAQQGFNLAGINALAKMIEAKWLYTALAVVTVALIIDTVFFIAMVRNFLNKTFSQQELDQFGITGDLTKYHTSEKIPNNSYCIMDSPVVKATATGEGQPAIYAVHMKDGDGNVDTIGFKTPEDRNAHITQLKADGFIDGKEAYKQDPEYSVEYMERLASHAAEIEKMSENLPRGYYRKKQFDIPDSEDKVVVVVVTDAEKATITHYCKVNKVNDVLEENYPEDLLDRDATKTYVANAKVTEIPVTLKEREFWPYEVLYTEQRTKKQHPLFAVDFYSKDVVPDVVYFRTPEAREDYIKNHFPTAGPNKWTNAQEAFSKKTEYTLDEVEKLIKKTPKFMGGINAGQYQIKTFTKDGTSVYGLGLPNKKAKYFTTDKIRTDYVNAHHKKDINLDEAYDALNGIKDKDGKIVKEGVLQRDQVANKCKKVKDFWYSTISLHNGEFYGLLDKQEEGFGWEVAPTLTELQNRYSKKNGYEDIRASEANKKIYTLKEVEDKLAEKPDFIQKIEKGQYETMTVATKSGDLLYALALPDGKDPIYFPNAEERVKYIGTHHPKDIDLTEVYNKLYGISDKDGKIVKKGVLQDDEVATHCTQEKEYWHSVILLDNGIKVYGALIKTKKKDKFDWYVAGTLKKIQDIYPANEGCVDKTPKVTYKSELKAEEIKQFLTNLDEASRKELQFQPNSMKSNQYWPNDYDVKGQIVYVVLIGQGEPRYFKDKIERDNAVKAAVKKGCYSFKKLQDEVTATIKKQNLRDLLKTNYMYEKADYKKIDGIPVAVLIYPWTPAGTTQTLTHEAFTAVEGKSASEVRENYLNSDGAKAKGFKPAADIYEKPKIYKEAYVKKIISQEHFDLVISEGTYLQERKGKELLVSDIPKTDKSGDVYALVWNQQNGFGFINTPQRIFFETAETRKAYCDKELAGYVDLTSAQNIRGEKHLEQCLTVPGEMYAFDVKSSTGNMYYMWYTRQKNGLVLNYADSDKKRKDKLAALAKGTPPLIDRTDFIDNKLNHPALEQTIEKIRKDKCIDLILEKAKQSWVEKDVEGVGTQKVDFVYWRMNDGSLAERVFEAGKGTDFITKYKFVDKQADFNNSAQYPPALGAELIKKAYTFTQSDYEARIAKMKDREVWQFKENKTKNANYPDIALTLIKVPGKSEAEYRYFKSDKLRDKHCKEINDLKYDHAFPRITNKEKFLDLVGATVSKDRPLYMIIDYTKDGGNLLLLMRKQNFEGNKWVVESRGIPVAQRDAEVAKLIGYTALTPAMLDAPLSKEEEAAIIKESGKKIEEHKKTLKADGWASVLSLEGNYATIIEYTKAGEEPKVQHYRAGGTEFKKRTNALL
jgi:hypothetical protein